MGYWVPRDLLVFSSFWKLRRSILPCCDPSKCISATAYLGLIGFDPTQAVEVKHGDPDPPLAPHTAQRCRPCIALRERQHWQLMRLRIRVNRGHKSMADRRHRR